MRRGASFALLAVLALGIAAAPARGDSPRLAEARRAVETVDYDAARRLLVEALHEGGNSPAAMAEIYRLLARAAVVLDQRDVAEQYYRRWLAIDPAAALPGDTAPKLREPFVAAQAYIAAHGRLLARARRTATGEIEVELLADPLAMAHAAAVVDPAQRVAHAPAGDAGAGSAVAMATRAPTDPGAAPGVAVASPSHLDLGGARRFRLAAGARVAILDDSGNRLLELDPGPYEPAAPSAPASPPAPEDRPRWTQRWVLWAIPTGVLTLGAAGFGIAAIASYGRAWQITDDSGPYFLADADANVRRGKIFVWLTAGAGAAAIGCAIPMVYALRSRRTPGLVVAPIAAPDQLGVTLGGRF